MSTSFSIDTAAVRAAGSTVARASGVLRSSTPCIDVGGVREYPLIHRALTGFTSEWEPALRTEIETLNRLGEATVGAANAAESTDRQNAAAIDTIDPCFTTGRPRAAR